PVQVPSIEELNLPPVVRDLAYSSRGLILVTGRTGAGKSTTLAAMVDTINRTTTRNIISVEDPIELLHVDRKSFIHQREIGIASNLAAVISQRLIPRADGKGRVPAVEVMVSTPTIREFILNPEKISLLHSIVAEGMTEYGMQTFDQSVLSLLRDGLITEQEA